VAAEVLLEVLSSIDCRSYYIRRSRGQKNNTSGLKISGYRSGIGFSVMLKLTITVIPYRVSGSGSVPALLTRNRLENARLCSSRPDGGIS
jgi:hypothetical protein